MESAFQWLASIMEWFGKFIPQFRIVRVTHHAVKFVRGKKAIHCPPGFYIYWPLTTEWDSYPIGRQSFVLRPQTMTTSDDRTIVFGFVLSYTVFNVMPILTGKVWSADETFEEICLGLANRVIATKTWEELKEAHRTGALSDELKAIARKELRRFGVNVKSANPTDLAPCKVFKLMTGAKGLQI